MYANYQNLFIRFFIPLAGALTPALCGHASALTGRTKPKTTSKTLWRATMRKTVARGHGQHQCFVINSCRISPRFIYELIPSSESDDTRESLLFIFFNFFKDYNYINISEIVKIFKIIFKVDVHN